MVEIEYCLFLWSELDLRVFTIFQNKGILRSHRIIGFSGIFSNVKELFNNSRLLFSGSNQK